MPLLLPGKQPALSGCYGQVLWPARRTTMMTRRFHASPMNNGTIVKMLLGAGADRTLTNNEGRTVLQIA